MTPKIEMTFRVEKVVNASNPVDQYVEAIQAENPWANPNYRNCKLILPIIDDDELKKYGPGLLLSVTFGS